MGASDEAAADSEPAKKSLLGSFDIKSLLAKKEKRVAAPAE